VRHGVLRPRPYLCIDKHARVHDDILHNRVRNAVNTHSTRTDLAGGAATGPAAGMHVQFLQLGNDAGEHIISICDAVACHPFISEALLQPKSQHTFPTA